MENCYTNSRTDQSVKVLIDAGFADDVKLDKGKIWMMKKLALTFLAVACLSLCACNAAEQAENTNKVVEAPGTAVYTKILQAEDFDRVIISGGLLQAESTVSVMPKIAGMEEITAVYVKVGDEVTKGQALAELDQKSAQLQYDSTKLQYDEALKNLNNTKALYEMGAVSQNDYESLETQVKSLEISLQSLQLSLDNLTITAPISGSIVSASAEVGSYASASSAMFTISDTTTLEIVAGISEGNVNKIAVGDTVSMRIPTASEAEYEGRIVEIGKVMDTTSKSYPVRIALDNKEGNFLSGMYAEVSIVTDRVTDCLVVPVDAITYREDEKVVMVVVDGKAEERVITTGVDDGDYYVVTEGLAAGDEVIVKGNVDLVNGEKVTVTKVVNELDLETAKEN